MSAFSDGTRDEDDELANTGSLEVAEPANVGGIGQDDGILIAWICFQNDYCCDFHTWIQTLSFGTLRLTKLD